MTTPLISVPEIPNLPEGSCTQPEYQATLDNAWIEDDSPRACEAIEVCKTACPVRLMCLQAGLNDPYATGIYGGIRFTLGAVSKAEAKDAMAEFGLTLRTRQLQRPSRALQAPSVG